MASHDTSRGHAICVCPECDMYNHEVIPLWCETDDPIEPGEYTCPECWRRVMWVDVVWPHQRIIASPDPVEEHVNTWPREEELPRISACQLAWFWWQVNEVLHHEMEDA